MNSFADFFAELKRRKVIRPTLIYAGLAWIAIQVVAVLVPILGGPPWLVRVLVVVILLGLPVAVVASWLVGFDPDRFRLAAPTEDERAERTRAGDSAPISRSSPVPASPLIGRKAEVEAVAALLGGEARVVTITGPGGTGKTRLAIAVADRVEGAFPDGVAFVSLAAVAEASDVLPALARALDVPEAEGRALADGLATRLGDRRVLLVLDNVEHVVEAAPDLAAVLARCPALRVLATSRAPLKIGAEAEYPLHPLALPDAALPPDDLAHVPSVALFVARAQKARPDFVLTAETAGAVAAICRRLDGLPLALELAAARVRVLDPQALLDRLARSLDVLTTGDRDLPERQRTLRATIAWSHDLLTEPEQQLFRRLAVFAGGWTQDAAEAVGYDGDASRALDEVSSLVEKGLVQPAGVPGRFDLLQTIRAFAGERLDASGEAEAIRARHAAYYLIVAEEVRVGVAGPRQLEAMARADVEAANHRAVLAHDRQRAALGDAEAAESGLRLCGSFWLYWHIRGLHVSALEWSDAFLNAPASPAASLGRCRALASAGLAATTLGDFARGVADCLTGAGIARDLGSAQDEARNWFMAGFGALSSGDLDAARTYLDRSLGLHRTGGLDWAWGEAIVHTVLGIVDAATGDPESARSRFDHALAVQTEIGDYEGAGITYGGLGMLAVVAGDHEAALDHYDDAFRAFATVGDRPEEARVLDALAWSSLALNRTDDARSYFLQSFQAYNEVASVRGQGLALLGLAATEAADGHDERALALEAAAEVFSEQAGIVNVYPSGSEAPDVLERARVRVAPDERERLAAGGRRLSVAEAVQLALTPTPAA